MNTLIGFNIIAPYQAINITIMTIKVGSIVVIHYEKVRRNFSNKMLHLGILTQLEETVILPNKKEAFLYNFNAENYQVLKQKGFRLEF